MKRSILLSTIITMMIFVSCQPETKKESTVEVPKVEEEKKDTAKHWGYDGESNPEHWVEIEKESACGGDSQSPIDIVTANVLEKSSELKLSDIHFSDSTIIHDVTNNGHSIQYNFDKQVNSVDYKGTKYDLAQFHFHGASEHSVNGMHYPLAIHMVFVSQNKEYVVFAVMVEEGVENESFEFIETYLPVKVGEVKKVGKPHHSFAKYFSDDFAHYHYVGSLTTPPCTEGVNWFIFKNAVTASPEQVKALVDLMPRNNFRPTQPLNGREVFLSE